MFADAYWCALMRGDFCSWNVSQDARTTQLALPAQSAVTTAMLWLLLQLVLGWKPAEQLPVGEGDPLGLGIGQLLRGLCDACEHLERSVAYCTRIVSAGSTKVQC